MTTSRRFAYTVGAVALLAFFAFHTLPALQGFFYSLTNYKGYGDWEWVGLKNYELLFSDARIGRAYRFTFQFAIVSAVLTNVIALALAVGLNGRIAFRRTLRAVFFVPNILSLLIVGYIFNFIFSSAVPQLGSSLGIDALTTSILGNPDLAWLGIVVVAVWGSTAVTTIIYLAGLQTVPVEVYEAASLDGATGWRRFSRVTFPIIMPFVTINTLLTVKGFLMVFDQIVAMTNGGPGDATRSMSVLIFGAGFSGGEFAYQSANAIVFFIVIALVSLFQVRTMRSRERV
ncbi:carbohydrate ABC transporter permease [Cellulomonas endometrii]|uniref:carbohydrate ABC transporter permease n=1 Tax=Cellulomonas endometrii TaxID=3036301 RepID=UPI0024ACD05F|nr:sugar ABC transporter permease [Cellulomonas endometrii]